MIPVDKRSRQRRLAVLSAAVLGVALFAAGGCGRGDDEPRVATVGNSPPATAGAAGVDAVAQYVEAARKYVECMREGGVDLPDPGPKGEIDYGDLGKRKAERSFVTASERCKTILPPVPAELHTRPPMTEEQIASARAYAECMRAHGVPSFPDPGPDGYYPSREQGGQPDPQDGAGLRAGQLCEPVLRGEPPATAAPTGQGVG